MISDQEMNKIEFHVRVEIPIKQSVDEISDKEQIRIAMEEFNNRLLDKSSPNLEIPKFKAAQPVVYQDNVTFVFSFCVKQLLPQSIKGSEILDLVKNSCFDAVPQDWAICVLGLKNGDRYVSFPLYKG